VRAGRAALLAVLVACAAPATAHATFQGQPNNSLGTAAGPLQQGVTYSGKFASPPDSDYYKFDITQPNTPLHFYVHNDLPRCSTRKTTCPIYATLIDTAGHQLGGEGSTAGTGEVGPGRSAYIDWTFFSPGTYVLVFDSGSDDLPGYSFRFGPGPLFQSLSVPSRQRGSVVRGSLVLLPPGLNVRIALTFGGHPAGSLLRFGRHEGTFTFRVALNRATRRKLARLGKLTVTLRLTVFIGARTARAVRRVTLVAPT
jgi:hypothetical protein